MKIAIFGRSFLSDFKDSMIEILSKMKNTSTELYIYKQFDDFVHKTIATKYTAHIFKDHYDLPHDVDLMLSIGGDGTYLQAVSFIRDKGIPIVGINSGRLGFLANISKQNLSFALDEIIKGNYLIEKKSLLQLSTEIELFEGFSFALNEFTVHKKDSSSMIKIQTYLNNEFLNTYWADGLIISTPTGSTAYSMSAGGPILTPDSSNFILSPLAPHTLTVRPLVIPDHHELSLQVEGRNSNYLISLDYRNEVINKPLLIKLRKASFFINSIKLKSQSYFETLRNKLMWGIDNRN